LLLSVTTDDDSAAQWNGKGGCLFAKINPGTNIPTIIDELGRIHSKFDSENPFEYYFMDDVFNDLYKAEERLAKILASFTILAIVIACLGLFGAHQFYGGTTDQRNRYPQNAWGFRAEHSEIIVG
jgi:putative ABC transport system permease protein